MVRGYKPPVPIPGHIFTYGKTGSGKTFKNVAISEYYYEFKYKIWDIFGGLRKEGPFRCFPSDEKKLWRKFLTKMGVHSFKGPKEYPVDLYYPMLMSKLPKELPEKNPRIRSVPFTIDFKSLNIKDISVVTGSGTGNQERILKRIQKELNNDSNSEDILQWFEKTKQRKKMKRFAIYYNFFEPLCKERLFEGPRGKNVIKLKDIAKERDRFFVLVEDHIPEETYRYFFINYLIRQLFNLVNEDIIHKRNIVFLREINLFMKVEDESVQYKEQKQILRNEFSNLLRYGRSGIYAICDTQSPKEVRNITPGQEGIICLNRLPGEADREAACDRPKRDGRLNSTHISYIGMMPVQEMAVLEQGKNIRKINNVQPPKTMGWKPDTGKFINVWKNKYNTFKNIEDLKQDIEKRNKERAILESEPEDEEYGEEETKKENYEEEDKQENKSEEEDYERIRVI